MKTTPKKVFLLENGQYVEITYQQHQERKAVDKQYGKRWFIPVQDYLLETSREDYSEYYRVSERKKYLKKLDIKYGLLSLDAFQNDENNDSAFIAMEEEDIIEQIVDKLMIEKLRAVLPNLSSEEQELIKALYFKGLSEREWSKISGFPQKTINDCKHRILKKIKNNSAQPLCFFLWISEGVVCSLKSEYTAHLLRSFCCLQKWASQMIEQAFKIERYGSTRTVGDDRQKV